MADVKGIFRDVYLFYTKYHDSILTDSDWADVATESKQLYKKYPDQIYKDMIFAVIDQLDRERKEKER